MHRQIKPICILIQVIGILLLPFSISAQQSSELINSSADLHTCIAYALIHQPSIQQLRLNEEITRKDVGIALSDWLPQVQLDANFQQYIKQPVSFFPDPSNPEGPKREITTGAKNSSSLFLNINQVIFNNSVFIAGKTSHYYKLRSLQSTSQGKIQLIVQVSKAFYDVLLSNARMNFLDEDFKRQQRSLKDAQSQYENGITDKIDYQRAAIALNNIKAEITGNQEEVKAKYASLKELMGYPVNAPLTVSYDSLKMMQDSYLDTVLGMDYHKRIEYQILLTSLKLQKSNVSFYRVGFLPSLSAFANYNLIFQNDAINYLYNSEYPNSAYGLRLSIPIFEGTRRIQQLKRANLQYQQMALDTLNLKNTMNTQFTEAMASYKSNLKTWQAARENAALANQVYNTVRLQYNEGIKTYLEVIVSETDLRTSRINELNSLYRVLSSKIDVQQALGEISENQ